MDKETMKIFIYKWEYKNNWIYGYGIANKDKDNVYIIIKDFYPTVEVKGCNLRKKSLIMSKDVMVDIQTRKHKNSVLEFLYIKGLKQCCWIKLINNDLENLSMHDIYYLSIDIIPELHIMSFDIEVYSRDRTFPDPKKKEDSIICISVVSNKCDNITFINTNIDIKSTNIKYCNSEDELIINFYNYIKSANILIGYNTHGFDWRYINARHPLDSKMIEITWSSSAYTNNDISYPSIDGILCVDLYHYCKRTFNIDDYRLNTVSNFFNCGYKEDLNSYEMWDLWDNIHKNPDKISDIVKYCVKDCLLVMDIAKKCSMLESIISLSNITYTNVEELFTRGQQIRMKNMLYIECKKYNYHMEFNKYDKDEYKGAIVVECKPKLYKHAACMDFTSLYPSIIISENICYSTWNGKFFDKTKFGIIPNMVKKLVDARVKYKNNKPYANALKICANSVYGIFGSAGELCFTQAASRITYIGRINLEKSITFLTDKGFDVIYGDTDSCIYTNDVEMNDEMHIKLADEVTNLFPDPIKMKFECRYKKFLSLGKKMYITLDYDNNIKYKGVVAVRRDRCKFAVSIYKDITYRVMNDILFRDHCRMLISNIHTLDKSEFIIKKIYNGPYKMDNYPLEVYNRKYGPLKKGETFFVFVSTTENGKNNLGDKLRPIDNTDPIDYKWYLNNISKSIDSVMEASGKVFRMVNNI